MVVEDLLPLLGVLAEQHDRVADELRDGLGPGAAEQGHEARDLDVVEPGLGAVTAVDRDLGQARQHVVARVLALLHREVEEVRGRLEDGTRVLVARCDLPRLAAEAGVEPLADRLSLTLGHAQHACDDLDGEEGGEVGDHVEVG